MSLYQLNNLEMRLLGSAYGLLGLFSYALGGILADKFAPKRLLILPDLNGTGRLFASVFDLAKRPIIHLRALGGYLPTHLLAAAYEDHPHPSLKRAASEGLWHF